MMWLGDGLIGVETGLYFGNKNKYIENQNIFISGITQNNEQLIEWQISKIWVTKLKKLLYLSQINQKLS